MEKNIQIKEPSLIEISNELQEIKDNMKKPINIIKNSHFNGTADIVKDFLLNSQINNDEEFIIPNSMRRTSNKLLKPEKTELIGIRAIHIEKGAEPTVNIGNLSEPIDIAKLEMKMKKFPLNIVRSLNGYLFEEWSPNEMIIEND